MAIDTAVQRAALERLLNATGENDARMILRETGRRGAQVELERLIATRFAVRLLEERAPRWAIRDRLVSRGVNSRTAYRVIGAALDARSPGRPTICATSGPALARDLRSIEASHSMEASMPKSSKDMQAELSTAKARLTALDAPGALAAAAKADEDFETACSELTALKEARRPLEEVSPATERHRQAGIAKTMARREANRREHDARVLRAEIERLSKLLTGDDRVKQAKQLIKSVAQMVDEARTQVAAAEAAVTTIEGLIQAEVAAFDADQRNAAAQLLALVKAKTATADVPAANRDKITTMEMAKAEALAELAAARAALAAAEARHAEVERELLTAQADVAALAHEVALASYVDVLAVHVAAHIKAHRTPCHTVDPRALAADLAAAAERGS